MQRFRVQEETVTETMLLKLEAAFPDVVEVETYTRRREAATGADWLWIFDFRGELMPVLIQAKKIKGPWDGTDDWKVNFNENQTRRLADTADALGVGCQFCLYAPSWNGWCLKPSTSPFPNFQPRFLHLMEATTSRTGRVDHRLICGQMVPFTCWCCCSQDPWDAALLFGVSDDMFRRGDNELKQLLGLAREAKTVKGSVVLKMKGERRG